MKLVDPMHGNENPRARTGIAMMFAQMKAEAVARDLHIEWQALGETMFPVNIESEETKIEFPCLGLIENTQDRYCVIELDRH